MNNGIDSVRISLRLADGEHFPIFRYDDPPFRTLSLVPATRGQDEADIQIFFHSKDGSPPQLLGMLRFPDLPPDSSDLELQLDASIDGSGMLTIVVTEPEGGRTEKLEAALPDAGGSSAAAGKSAGRRLKVVMGIVFVLAGLALVFWLTLGVARWGRQDAPPPPLSGRSGETRQV